MQQWPFLARLDARWRRSAAIATRLEFLPACFRGVPRCNANDESIAQGTDIAEAVHRDRGVAAASSLNTSMF
ncbi:hypothetical protein [Paraburkholderia caballeronis]|uniref:hypothetical protein n=1 Tax=Paraburkholderia caballeronis TaxID=416943 RepID=UPI00115F8549|nr:hypothetical protein [Paraburkholderia caballeronis]